MQELNPLLSFEKLDKYVINLPDRTDRWEEFQRDAEKYGVTNYQRIDGVRPEKYPGVFKQSKYGVYLGHKQCWEICVEKGEPIVVFEDDASPKRKPFIPYHKEIEDFDFIYLGSNDNFSATKVGHEVFRYRDNRLPCKVRRAKKIYANHAYIVSPRGAYRALQLPPNPMGTDVMLWGVFHKGKSFYIKPTIFHQRPSYSDNYDNYRDMRKVT